ncbi:L,D-transpeptidase [Microtetraspora niveoalba]|uniref:L,D-transpeptidase n=1 Tax=Microtetraspora niveoalba TaxID=46175 RepID=UPI000832F410|nr:L,D-transpeptidase [Microtetraspora niveoalba]
MVRQRRNSPTRARDAARFALAGALTAALTLGLAPARAASVGQVTTLDAATHQMTVTENGRTVMTFTAGFGKPGFRTPNGTFHVIGKDADIRMTSCSASITCDPRNPNYYDREVHWAVRLTGSGLFIHAAPWDDAIGQVDSSHGCVHLSTEDAHRFYDSSRIGDTVIINNTGGPVGGPTGP